MKPLITVILLTLGIAFSATLRAQTGVLAGAAAAAAASSLTKGNAQTKAGVALGAGLVTGLIGNAIENNNQRRQLEAYTLGRFQEAYIQAYSTWYKSTLDPHTGRPPAYDGHWAMNIGMPDQDMITPVKQTRQVPNSRQAYEKVVTDIKTQNAKETQSNTAKAAATTVTTTRKKVINGVEYAETKVIYPRLPPGKRP